MYNMKKTDDGHYQLSVAGVDAGAISINGRIYPGPSADFDGDSPHVDHKEMEMFKQLMNIAAENYQRLRDATTYEERLAIIETDATYNRSKFKSMSTRRKKIFVQKFNYYDVRTGDLIHHSRRGQLYIEIVPIIHTTVEKSGAALDNMLKAWAGYLAHP